MTGLVFEVKRGAVHDGPGLRTTVFLKGCPLYCPWCHNPEGISPRPELWVLPSRCMSCGSCTSACPNKAVHRGHDGIPLTDRQLCTVCGRCVDVCPTGARAVVGRMVTAGELVEELSRDRAFFEASGGGVTFSGGEPLLQLEFLMDALVGCREVGLHTALDTCGYAPKESLLQAAAVCDLVLVDVKDVDPKRHERTVGVPLEPILDNLRALDETGATIWVRVPLIPDFNDDPATMEGFADLVRELRTRPLLCLLPYHRAGAAKYTRLGREYAMEDLRPTQPGNVETLAERLGAAGVRVRIGG